MKLAFLKPHQSLGIINENDWTKRKQIESLHRKKSAAYYQKWQFDVVVMSYTLQCVLNSSPEPNPKIEIH